MAIPLITLERVVTDIPSKADYLVATYFYSHNKQNDLSPETVMSLPARMASLQDDPNGLGRQIENDITYLLEGYFDAIRATVSVEAGEVSYKINLTVNVIEGGKSYDLATLIQTEGKLVREISRITSDGKSVPFRPI